ncbi:MAG: hypothetical protein EBZ74_06960 [Planctomycetia bacterium]|nr:hypothetical protein [Planctomycetia bacterium]
MAYKVTQDESSSSQQSWWATQWSSFISGSTWEESLSLSKLSNILGWSDSTVLGYYMSNYGFLKTQLMLGFERKINLASKYEWYMTAPTKVLMQGENKIDMKEYNKVAPVDQKYVLKHKLTMSQDEIEAFERNLKAFKDAKTVAGASSTTCASHTLTVNTGDSEETIALGAKIVNAAGDVRISGLGGVTLMQSEASWLEVTAGGCTVTAPTINLG